VHLPHPDLAVVDGGERFLQARLAVAQVFTSVPARTIPASIVSRTV